MRREISNTKNLFIIPDGILYYLPFEALFQKKLDVKDDVNFSELPYLVKKFNISYLFSASFLQNETKKSDDQYSFVGFAPVFADENSQPEQRKQK